MSRLEILMTVPMLQTVIDALESAFVIHRLWEEPDPAGFFMRNGPAIRGIATSTRFGLVGAELLGRLPNVEIIASFGVGYDHVDIVEAARRGIVVTNTPGVLDDEVADLAIGLTLATLRQIPQADRYLRDGHWPGGSFALSPTLRDRRVGIVGLGRIGKAIARRFEGFDVPIAYHGRHKQSDLSYAYHEDLIALAQASDILVVMAPGGPDTLHLIDEGVLQALGREGVLINLSRGSVVDQSALIDALRAGTILAAGLDVYEDEPHVPPDLIALQNTVLLPHIASGTVHTRRAMGQLAVDNLISWFEGHGAITPVHEPFS